MKKIKIFGLLFVIATLFSTAGLTQNNWEVVGTFKGLVILKYENGDSVSYKFVNPGIGYFFFNSLGINEPNPKAILHVGGSFQCTSIKMDNAVSDYFGNGMYTPTGHSIKVPEGDHLDSNVIIPWPSGQFTRISISGGLINGVKTDYTPPTEREIANTKFAEQKFDENNNEGVELYPNPFIEQVSITPPKGCVQIMFIDTEGRITLYGRTGTGNHKETLNISSLTTGQYLINFLNSEGKSILRMKGLKL